MRLEALPKSGGVAASRNQNRSSVSVLSKTRCGGEFPGIPDGADVGWGKEGDRAVLTLLLEQLGAGWLTKMGRDRRRQQENSISRGGGHVNLEMPDERSS